MSHVAEAIREVTAAMQKAIASGERSRLIDANDLIDVLLAIADELDPPIAESVGPGHACPGCGEQHSERLSIQDDETVRCATCGMTYTPR